jgi:hypothetical protein
MYVSALAGSNAFLVCIWMLFAAPGVAAKLCCEHDVAQQRCVLAKNTYFKQHAIEVVGDC